jgi:phenylpropionate dioxygenase-like ring-hydroxylating dioxygenase large terminal subunit
MTTIETEPTVAVPAPWRLGPAFVPKGRYLDRDFLQLELNRLFPKVWLNACHMQEVETVGSFVEFTIGDESIIIVRTDDETLKAYFNSCRHRGTRLVAGRGRLGGFRCPFHAWQWNLDGTNRWIPDRENFLPCSDEDVALRECRIDTWGGWVFVNMDPDAEGLADFLDPVRACVDPLQPDRMRISWHKTTVLPCNWKTALDAFNEGYHVPATHPQYTRPQVDRADTPSSIEEIESDPAWTPSETFGRHGHFRTQPRSGAAFNPRPVTPHAMYNFVEYHLRELRALFTQYHRLAAAELCTMVDLEVAEIPGTLRNLRKKYAEADGLEWPLLDDDALRRGEGDWHIFPNMVFLIYEGVMLAYRARPNGDDPDSCIFDIWALQLFPPGQEPAVEHPFFADWREGDMGEVLSQDFSNVGRVSAGMHSQAFVGHRLNLAQEMSIYNAHAAADTYLFG